MTRSVAHRIHVPDGAKFSCESCGRCCTGWTIPVEQAAYDRLQAHDWDGQPFERFERDGHPYRIRLVDDGRCFFLDGNRRCRIHSELSYDVKPAACRAFPLAVMEMDGRRYGRLSSELLTCPAENMSAFYDADWATAKQRRRLLPGNMVAVLFKSLQSPRRAADRWCELSGANVTRSSSEVGSIAAQLRRAV